MKPRTLTLVVFTALLGLCGCETQTQTAAKLQSNLATAKTSSVAVGTHVTQAQGSLSRANYKATRAKQLLDQVEKPF